LGEMVRGRVDNWAKWLGSEMGNGFGRIGIGRIGKRAKWWVSEMVIGRGGNWAKWLGGEMAKGRIGYGLNGIVRNGNTPLVDLQVQLVQ
jgi:hypothetical protein